MYKPTLPSSLLSERAEDDSDFSFLSKMFDNNSLRVGVVLDIIDVGDKNNQSGLAPEYRVMTAEQNKQGSISNVEYKNCLRLNALGGVADYFFTKLRKPKDSAKVKSSGSMKDQVGSIVLLMCLDGNSEKGIILGSLDHPSAKKLSKEHGHHMEGEFNGVNWQVNKDGALTVTFKSATEDDGTPKDEKAGGTVLKIEKDGSMEFNDGNTEKIRVDKTKKTIDANAENDISVASAKKNINVTAGESVNITAKKDLIAMATGKAAFSISKTLDITAKGAASMKVKELKVDSKTMIKMKAQSMIELDAASSMMLKAPTVLVGPAPSQPALLAYDLITLGTGNLGAPVISQAIAGYSTSVIISS